MSETQPSDHRDPLQACFERLAAAELGSPQWEAACRELARLAPADVPSLIAALATQCRPLRAGVVRTLKGLGAAVYYDLIAALSPEQPASIRTAAAGLLYGVIQQGQVVAGDAVPGLAWALSDACPQLRHRATVTLELIGGDAVAAVPELMLAVSDDEAIVREWSAHALAAIGAPAAPALAALTEALLDDDPNVRQAASDAIDVIRGERHGG